MAVQEVIREVQVHPSRSHCDLIERHRKADAARPALLPPNSSGAQALQVQGSGQHSRAAQQMGRLLSRQAHCCHLAELLWSWQAAA